MSRRYFEKMLDEAEYNNFQRWFASHVNSAASYNVPPFQEEFLNSLYPNRYDYFSRSCHVAPYWLLPSLSKPTCESLYLMKRNEQRSAFRNYNVDKYFAKENGAYQNRRNEGKFDYGRNGEFFSQTGRRHSTNWNEAASSHHFQDTRYGNRSTKRSPTFPGRDFEKYNYQQSHVRRYVHDRLATPDLPAEKGEKFNLCSSPSYQPSTSLHENGSSKQSEEDAKKSTQSSSSSQLSVASVLTPSPVESTEYASWYNAEEQQQIVNMLREVNLRHDRQLRRDVMSAGLERPCSDDSVSSNVEHNSSDGLQQALTSDEEDDGIVVLVSPEEYIPLPDIIASEDEHGLNNEYLDKSASDYFEEFQSIFTVSPEKIIIKTLKKEFSKEETGMKDYTSSFAVSKINISEDVQEIFDENEQVKNAKNSLKVSEVTENVTIPGIPSKTFMLKAVSQEDRKKFDVESINVDDETLMPTQEFQHTICHCISEKMNGRTPKMSVKAIEFNQKQKESSEFLEVSSECPIVSLKCPIVTVKCPIVSSEDRIVSSEFPIVSSSECPVVSAECPIMPSECPIMSSEYPIEDEPECPNVPSECPNVLSECPNVPSECPNVPSDCPIVSSECPIVSSECSIRSSECSKVSSECPIVSSKCPKGFAVSSIGCSMSSNTSVEYMKPKYLETKEKCLIEAKVKQYQTKQNEVVTNRTNSSKKQQECKHSVDNTQNSISKLKPFCYSRSFYGSYPQRNATKYETKPQRDSFRPSFPRLNPAQTLRCNNFREMQKQYLAPMSYNNKEHNSTNNFSNDFMRSHLPEPKYFPGYIPSIENRTGTIQVHRTNTHRELNDKCDKFFWRKIPNYFQQTGLYLGNNAKSETCVIKLQEDRRDVQFSNASLSESFLPYKNAEVHYKRISVEELFKGAVQHKITANTNGLQNITQHSNSADTVADLHDMCASASDHLKQILKIGVDQGSQDISKYKDTNSSVFVSCKEENDVESKNAGVNSTMISTSKSLSGRNANEQSKKFKENLLNDDRKCSGTQNNHPSLRELNSGKSKFVQRSYQSEKKRNARETKCPNAFFKSSNHREDTICTVPSKCNDGYRPEEQTATGDPCKESKFGPVSNDITPLNNKEGTQIGTKQKKRRKNKNRKSKIEEEIIDTKEDSISDNCEKSKIPNIYKNQNDFSHSRKNKYNKTKRELQFSGHSTLNNQPKESGKIEVSQTYTKVQTHSHEAENRNDNNREYTNVVSVSSLHDEKLKGKCMCSVQKEELDSRSRVVEHKDITKTENNICNKNVRPTELEERVSEVVDGRNKLNELGNSSRYANYARNNCPKNLETAREDKPFVRNKSFRYSCRYSYNYPSHYGREYWASKSQIRYNNFWSNGNYETQYANDTNYHLGGKETCNQQRTRNEEKESQNQTETYTETVTLQKNVPNEKLALQTLYKKSSKETNTTETDVDEMKLRTYARIPTVKNKKNLTRPPKLLENYITYTEPKEELNPNAPSEFTNVPKEEFICIQTSVKSSIDAMPSSPRNFNQMKHFVNCNASSDSNSEECKQNESSIKCKNKHHDHSTELTNESATKSGNIYMNSLCLLEERESAKTHREIDNKTHSLMTNSPCPTAESLSNTFICQEGVEITTGEANHIASNPKHVNKCIPTISPSSKNKEQINEEVKTNCHSIVEEYVHTSIIHNPIHSKKEVPICIETNRFLCKDSEGQSAAVHHSDLTPRDACNKTLKMQKRSSQNSAVASSLCGCLNDNVPQVPDMNQRTDKYQTGDKHKAADVQNVGSEICTTAFGGSSSSKSNIHTFKTTINESNTSKKQNGVKLNENASSLLSENNFKRVPIEIETQNDSEHNSIYNLTEGTYCNHSIECLEIVPDNYDVRENYLPLATEQVNKSNSGERFFNPKGSNHVTAFMDKTKEFKVFSMSKNSTLVEDSDLRIGNRRICNRANIRSKKDINIKKNVSNCKSMVALNWVESRTSKMVEESKLSSKKARDEARSFKSCTELENVTSRSETSLCQKHRGALSLKKYINIRKSTPKKQCMPLKKEHELQKDEQAVVQCSKTRSECKHTAHTHCPNCGTFGHYSVTNDCAKSSYLALCYNDASLKHGSSSGANTDKVSENAMHSNIVANGTHIIKNPPNDGNEGTDNPTVST